MMGVGCQLARDVNWPSGCGMSTGPGCQQIFRRQDVNWPGMSTGNLGAGCQQGGGVNWFGAVTCLPVSPWYNLRERTRGTCSRYGFSQRCFVRRCCAPSRLRLRLTGTSVRRTDGVRASPRSVVVAGICRGEEAFNAPRDPQGFSAHASANFARVSNP